MRRCLPGLIVLLFCSPLLALDTAMGVSGALPPYFSVLLARKR